MSMDKVVIAVVNGVELKQATYCRTVGQFGTSRFEYDQKDGQSQ